MAATEQGADRDERRSPRRIAAVIERERLGRRGLPDQLGAPEHSLRPFAEAAQPAVEGSGTDRLQADVPDVGQGEDRRRGCRCAVRQVGGLHPADRPPFGLVVNLGGGLPHRGRAAGRPAGMCAHRPLTASPSHRRPVSLSCHSHCLAVSPTRRRAVPPGCSAPPLASRCPGGPGAYRPSSRRRRMPCRSAVPHRAARLPSSRPVDTPAGGGGAVPLGPPPERRRESPQPRRMSAHAIFLSVRLTVLRSRCLTVWLPGQPSSRPALCPSGPVGRRPTFPATGCRAVRPTFSPPDVPSPHLAVRPSGRPAVRLSHSPADRLSGHGARLSWRSD